MENDVAGNNELRKTLELKLSELLGRSQVIEDDLRNPLEADSSEQAIDLADDESLAGVDEVLRREIHEIRLALVRIEDGSYGTCMECGDPIRPERLEALPTATKCINCA